MTSLTTARLRLEPMTDAHLHGLFEMNRDLDVMRYITGKPDTLEDTQAMIDRVKARWAEWGYSWWTFFEIDTGEIVGAGCIQHLGRDAANPHEIGWGPCGGGAARRARASRRGRRPGAPTPHL